MAGWTKADYDLNYDIGAEGEWGYPNTRAEVRLHYNWGIMQPLQQKWWANLVPLLGITAADRVCVIGAGFGWGVEALLAEAPGVTAIGIDISDYINAEKGTDEDADLDAAITAVGLDPATDRGAQIKTRFRRDGPRAKVTILQEDLSNNGSRNRVRNAIGGLDPTWIITEDTVQTMPDAELTQYTGYANDFTGAQVVHFLSGPGGAPWRTPAQLLALSPGSWVVLSNEWVVHS